MCRSKSRLLATLAGFFLVAVPLALGGCASAMDIGTLLDDPARYDGETVRVSGEVTEAAGALGRGAYRLRDETGTLTIVSREDGAPRSGARVSVEGEFRALLTLGERSAAALMEESRSEP